MKTVTPTPLQLALGFARLSLQGFGGVGGQARHVLVGDRRWLTEDEFAELSALCQALPGPNTGNLALMLGDRAAGTWGALCAMIGFVVPSTVLAILIAIALSKVSHLPRVAAVESAVVSAAAGLIVASGARIAQRLTGAPLLLIVTAAIVVAIDVAHVPLVVAVVLGAPVAMLLARVRFGR
ncbi:MAG TPA: chromate transporter [Candidatus Elarobacter sp.]|nr:chromate transporter [Candidatus Elarobacter sp.]